MVTKCLQFGLAFLAESPQRIDGVAVHQLANFREGPVGREIHDRVRLPDHGGLDTTRILLIRA